MSLLSLAPAPATKANRFGLRLTLTQRLTSPGRNGRFMALGVGVRIWSRRLARTGFGEQQRRNR